MPGYNPDIATADGGIIADAGGSYYEGMYVPGPASTFDAKGNATGQLASLPTQSWIGNTYQLGSVVLVVSPLIDLAGSFWAVQGGTFPGQAPRQLPSIRPSDK